MKVQQIREWGGPDQLNLEEVTDPSVGPAQVLVATRALGVNPVDWKLLTGKAPVLPPLPHIPGGDIAGVVEAIGDGVSGFSVGDRVFGLIGLMGAYAEKLSVDPAVLAAIPAGMDFATAAALPLVSLTAMQGLLADGRPLGDLDILVHGGAGGVGMAAIQIAAAEGARVTASASAGKADFVRGLGAGRVVDFRSGDTGLAAGSFDVLVDLVGDSQEAGLWQLVRSGGSVIRIAGGATAPAEEEVDGVRAYKVRVRPDGRHVARVASLFEAGKLVVLIEERFAFEDAAKALEQVKAGHVTGKLVLLVD